MAMAHGLRDLGMDGLKENREISWLCLSILIYANENDYWNFTVDSTL